MNTPRFSKHASDVSTTVFAPLILTTNLMSANNMSIVKEHKGKWYIFIDINAEAWNEPGIPHTFSIKHAQGVYNSRDEAFEAAQILDSKCGQYGEGTEYGVHFSRLCKDDTPVELTE